MLSINSGQSANRLALSIALLCGVLAVHAQDDYAPVPYQSGPTSRPSSRPHASRPKSYAGTSQQQPSSWIIREGEKAVEKALEYLQEHYPETMNHLNWKILTGKSYEDLPPEVHFDNEAPQLITTDREKVMQFYDDNVDSGLDAVTSSDDDFDAASPDVPDQSGSEGAQTDSNAGDSE